MTRRPDKSLPPYESFRPGEEWLDTSGEPIQAHGGSILALEDGSFVWYGENKDHTTPGSGVWHWGVRAYQSTDLYNWEDRGLIIPPVLDDVASPLHPTRFMDRPHIVYNPATQKYVCWIKVMGSPTEGIYLQRSTVLVADSVFGPYEIVHGSFLPLGMSAGDFDITVDADGTARYIFGKVHTEIVCADLTDDFLDVSGTFSTHLPRPGTPFAREAPAHFARHGIHYVATSATTGYFPNPTEVAATKDLHGEWRELGALHRGDEQRTSFRTQISSVFKHPGKAELYIAVADRWLPQIPAEQPTLLDATIARDAGQPVSAADHQWLDRAREFEEMTAASTYVWLPIRFDGDEPYIEWLDEWRTDTFV